MSRDKNPKFYTLFVALWDSGSLVAKLWRPPNDKYRVIACDIYLINCQAGMTYIGLDF
jgi:hypothetical protein